MNLLRWFRPGQQSPSVAEYNDANEKRYALLVTNVDSSGATGTEVNVPDGQDAALGATTDAAIVTDANGTAIGFLRGLVKILGGFSKGAGAVDANTLRVITSSDGPTVAVLGATADAAVSTDAAGSINAHLRGLIALWIGGLKAGEAHIGEVGGRLVVAAAAQFTRPNDAAPYAIGDLIANSTTAGSVVPLQFTVARVAAGSGSIRKVRVRKSGVAVAAYRLHLYKASPVCTNGDNGAWLTDQSASYLGSLDVTVDKVFTDGSAGNGVPTTGSEISFQLASGQVIYGLLEVRSVYTPTALSTHDVAIECFQN